MLKLSTNTPTVSSHFAEIELLLCCARTNIDTEIAEQIKALLQEDIDWAYLTQIAYQHGVMMLLYKSLNTTCPEAVPKTILNQLQRYFHANAQRNLFLTGELLKVLNLFTAHDIPAIPYKGPALAALAYGNVALRQFGDLDVVVHEQDFIKARDLLISHGYQPPIQISMAQTKPYLQSEQFRESAQYEGSYNIARNDGKVVVELHWRLTPKYFTFPISLEQLWKNLEPLPLAGTTVLNFMPENMLLILCMHGTKDAWKQLKWICDIAELIRAHRMDWERVLKQAITLGSERMLFIGLLLAHTLLKTALPEAVLQKIQTNSAIKLLVAEICGELFSNVDEAFAGDNKLLLQLRSRERFQDRVHRFLHFMTTPSAEDWENLPLPTYLYSLYYPLRPIRLVGQYGISRLKHLLNT